jgi:hypothetical protein
MTLTPPKIHWQPACPCGYVLQQGTKVLASVWPKSGAWYAEAKGQQSTALPNAQTARDWAYREAMK